MVSYFGWQSLCKFLVEAASVIYLAVVTVDREIFTWIKTSSCRLHEAALTVFVQVLAQLAFGLWHGLLAADKCLFHIKTKVSIQWNSTLWLLLVGWLVPGKGGVCAAFFWFACFFYSSLLLSERCSFVFVRSQTQKTIQKGLCPYMDRKKKKKNYSKVFT